MTLARFNTWWKELSEEEAEERRLLEPDRVFLISALMSLDIAINAFYLVWRVRNQQSDPYYNLLPGGLTLLLLGLLRWKPDRYRWIARFCLLQVFLFIIAGPDIWNPGYLAPTMVFLPLLPFLSLMLDGPRAGLVMMALESLFFLFYLHQVPGLAPRDGQMRFNLLLNILGYFWVGWAAWRQFQRLNGIQKENASVLRELNDECERSLKNVFEKLETHVRQMGLLLNGEGPVDPTLLTDPVASIHGLLRGFGQNPGPGEEKESIPGGLEQLGEARLRVAKILAAAILILQSFSVFRILYSHPPLRFYPFLAPYLLLVFVAFVLLRQTRWEKRLAWLLVMTVIAIFFTGCLYWGYGEPAPGLVSLPAILMFSSLLELEGFWLRGTAMTFCLAGLGFYSLTPAPLPSPQLKLLVSLMLMLLVALASGWVFWRLRRRLLMLLEDQNERYRVSLRVRRRLLGTLRHDIINPLSAINLFLSVNPRTPDWAQIRALTARMANILRNSRDLLETGPQSTAAHLGRLDWNLLVVRVREVFGGWLGQKGLTLEVQGDMSTNFACHPEVLCDSVLANLVSNAIKFSPRGAKIELTCGVAGTQVWIRVADRGPGIPGALLDEFRKGHRLPSGKGSEGEKGTGLGLLLAHDYARFMGGELELGPREGGGTEATLRLRKYNPLPAEN